MRERTRRYTSDYPCLDLTAISKRGFFNVGQSGESSCKRGDYSLWAFSWLIQENNIQANYRLSGGNKDGDYQHTIQLVRQPVHYGSERYYLECPQCRARRKQLYFVGGIAACRVCHNLHYQSQSESYSERKYRKLDHLLTKVRNFGYRFDGHWKAKGQHWRTYHKLDTEINQLQKSIFADIDKRFGFGEAFRHFG